MYYYYYYRSVPSLSLLYSFKSRLDPLLNSNAFYATCSIHDEAPRSAQPELLEHANTYVTRSSNVPSNINQASIVETRISLIKIRVRSIRVQSLSIAQRQRNRQLCSWRIAGMRRPSAIDGANNSRANSTCRNQFYVVQ